MNQQEFESRFVNQIICGFWPDVAKDWPDNTFDTIITDAPYGLSFMGKKWDYDVPSVESWRAALRVLKPGGTLLCFAGARTQHRMAVNIEDAGFLLKDCIMWLYGCLSEDTEILTKKGWKPLHKTTKYDMLLIYDIANNFYKWETPERWQIYSVHKDTAYRIKSDKTDQIVSKEHRCLVEREGKLIFKQAWELSTMERVPILPQDFYPMGEGFGQILFKKLRRKIKGLAAGNIKAGESRLDEQKPGELQTENVGGEQSSLEGWSNLFQKKGKLRQIQDKICSMSQRIFGYGPKRRLRYGASAIGSTKTGQMPIENRDNTPHRPQSREQQNREPNAFFKQPTPQTARSTITKIEYTGRMFCPTVSTGAFVARRKGKVFITGNSGFPKATDISKQLDKANGRRLEQYIELGNYLKKQRGDRSQKSIAELFPSKTGGVTGCVANWELGFNVPTQNQWKILKKELSLDDSFDELIRRTEAKREIVGEKSSGLSGGSGNTVGRFTDSRNENGNVDITKPTTPEAKLWNGWKSHGLKPAYEPIIVAMKPNEGSYAKNALKWGVSGLNIDGGRIGHNETIKTTVRTAKRHGISLEMNTGKSDKWKEGTMASANPSGRFPANVILDPEAAAMVDEQSGELKSGDNCRRTKEGYFGEHGGLGKAGDLQTTYGDSGGASRVFYVAKASKAERNAGCEGLPKGEPPASARSKPAEGRNAPLGEPRANHHPTVKPLDLMRYLVRLTATPTGGIVLDMYCGSGTTLMACVIEGRDYCGIDKEPEYVAIANKRLEVCKAGVPVKEQRAGQYALFESMESMAKL